jgi:2',3'-cyclic-nucleotide 2'-phosphodiesterase/3'-nucleotidase/5'-nucleotidase
MDVYRFIAQLTQLRIANGVDTRKFAPKSIANRAQAAVIIYRMLENIASQPHSLQHNEHE